MIATIQYIEQKFDEFNELCFSGTLPKIPIELSNAKTFLGVCVYKKRRNLLGKTTCYDFRLRINKRIDLPEDVLEDTIIHEMIHYYILVNDKKDTSAHGVLFRKIMNSINEKHNRHITISHRSTKEQREQLYNTMPKWHVVATVTFNDGKTGVKVLPRKIPSILRYYNNVLRAKGVVSINLYMSKDIFFNRFPTSSALNIRFVETSELNEHLRDAEQIRYDGENVLWNK